MDLKAEWREDLKSRERAYNKSMKAVEALMEVSPAVAFQVIENMKEMLRQHFHGTDTSSSHGSMEDPQ